ncbi:hypothetical protein BKA56DRAFT_695433 [Ilyonectria sp. MPI-CAGE-AT-0026]|nr:hypothetical protein BKA56DRAFT_695433 [Ilyonectria sp. MPI-CAGE-AT-0026]
MDEALLIPDLPGLMLQLYNLTPSQIPESPQFQMLQTAELDKVQLLASIPATSESSYRPLHLLYVLLTEIPGPWPTFDLIKCHTRLFKILPEEAKARRNVDWDWLVDTTDKIVKKSCAPFCQFIGRDEEPALRATTSDYITHRGLHRFVSNFRLPVIPGRKKPVVGIALPNGPLLAATCIAVTSYYIAAPINQATGPEQFQSDILQAGADFILTTDDDYKKLQLGSWTTERNIQVFIIDWTSGDSISIRTLTGGPLPNFDTTSTEPNQGDDIGMILFTSGTSGTKKVVPLTTHSIIAGIVFVKESWGLTSTDICLNMMPLYHVGGLVRNIFAPVFSGGSTVCCAAFDPNTFWDVVQDIQPTWYYASPSMHSLILSEATGRPEALKKSRIRLACNAAGGLLPSLAYRLRDTFKCVVLPSYGMTECMPISTPPLNYQLDREGTSGISTGPELAILDGSEAAASSGTVGRICVRGEPVFPGYLKPDGTYDRSPFNKDGWFDTGDLGYMDPDGYLYVTGRSKEVINRGGELISPFEVENAIISASLSDSPISGRISQALVFSACHDILQEVVAVVLVSAADKPRVDLKTLHDALRSSLQQAKWPVLITYMDDLPKKNNKVLRIRLGQRLGIPEITDKMPYLSRHLEAACPPCDTDLSVQIKSSICSVDYEYLQSEIEKIAPDTVQVYCRRDPQGGGVEAFLAPTIISEKPVQASAIKDLQQKLGQSIDNFMVPSLGQIHAMTAPFPRDTYGNIDEERLQEELDRLLQESVQQLGVSTEGLVTKAFAEILSRPHGDLPDDVDFFTLGGDSLRAGRLTSVLRSQFNVNIPIGLIFNDGTVKALASHIDKMTEAGPIDNGDGRDNIVGCSETYSSTNPVLMLVQLIPLAFIYPLRRALQWTIFITLLAYSEYLPTNHSIPGRLLNLIASITLAGIIIEFIAPIFGILCKWLIIGRHREGLYPMWAFYHTRWWLVQKITSICGPGVFEITNSTQCLYYRLMGAKIGRNVRLGGAALGEWDLLEIGDNTDLSECICRPFAVEGNTTMYLGRISIGDHCSVGTASIIAPGTTIPPNTCIGLNSSNWEMEDADEAYRSSSYITKPHWLLVCLFTLPLRLFSGFLSLVPWMCGLLGMVIHGSSSGRSPILNVIDWFTHPQRIAYHYLALVLKCFIGPFIILGFTILIKAILDIAFGKLGPGSAGQGTVATWRAHLINSLCPVDRLHEVTGMFGQHYEATSTALRMLGARIGQRVYWPGTGPVIGDYHLLHIGDDVVFGSRTHLVTSDIIGSDTITIGDRAMIADRVCLLPGVKIGDRVTMGSGALTKRGKQYPANGTYVGSKGGDSVCLSTGRQLQQQKVTSRPISMKHMSSCDTLTGKKESSDTDVDASTENSSPFGRAFYLKQAPYWVLGPFTIFCYSSFLTLFTSFYWNIASISSIQFINVVIKFLPSGTGIGHDVWRLFVLSFGAIAVITTAQAILALAIVLGAKWTLLGRRKPGNYDWDKSSYCQRWQVFLTIEKIRRRCYQGNGILGLLTGTNWIVLYFRAMGSTIGKDCALFANGTPSLMFTEPDLITLGDRVSIDDASVVAHINTRGKFDLNRLEIGDRCVLRTGSRLLSGATMQKDSCLLEHTLIMGGDVVEENSTMQGWPAEPFSRKRVNL